MHNKKFLSSTRLRQLRIEQLEQRQMLAGDTYLVNFQFDEASTPPRYLRDVGDVFGDRGNGFSYGWSSDHVDQSRERSIEADQRLDTLIHIEAGQSWEFALDNGIYEVTVAVGDPATNDGVHTINVEGVNFFNAVADGTGALFATAQVTVADGRLTLDAGAAADMATRIDFMQIVGLPSSPNNSPANPVVTEPEVDGQEVNPVDVHMEAVGFSDADGDAHKSSDWEIWTVGTTAEPVWQTLGIQGVERLHTHLGDGIFLNGLAGLTELQPNTDYELRVRFRDDVGSVSGYATRLFSTGSASTVFPLELEDVSNSPALNWTTASGANVDLPFGSGILAAGDAIVAVDLDGDSDSPANEDPANAIDNTLDKYLNFGEENSGFIVTPSFGASVLNGFQITTANDAEERDPTDWQLFGTNDAVTSANHSDGSDENWTLIDSGTLALPALRDTAGPITAVTTADAYTSYRMIFTDVKNSGGANSMQFAEIQFFGDSAANAGLLSPADAILAIDLDGDSDYPENETPVDAIDRTLDKYLNFGKENAGFIVTPGAGSSTVNGFQITTANDLEERDPASWTLYGTNGTIASSDNSNGSAETWTLIDSGSLALPAARDTLGAIVDVTNSTEYTSYRMVFPTLKNGTAANSMQIGEIQFFGENDVEPAPPELRLETAAGDLLYSAVGQEGPGNLVTNPAALADHAPVRVVVVAGGQSLLLNESDLTFEDESGRQQSIFLPNINLAAGQRMDFWVSSSGATYFGNEADTVPDFSLVARAADLAIPFIPTQPGFVIEEVGSDYRLPVNIAFVPNPGPNPTDPLYYVTELYGSIQVVTRDGTKHEFATGLLDYNPEGPISGSGEQGLTGIAVQRDEANPDIYHLYVGMLWDNGIVTGQTHFPKVERIDSVAGGLQMDTRTILLNMQPETQGQSHQISNITIGPDGKLYVHNGDGFNASTAQDLDQFRGKILRMNLDGTAPDDNPFYDASNGINSRDYVYAYGLRNPFGGAWRASDGKHYEVENGPSVDRMAQINAGVDYGWDGSNASMFNEAIYNWAPSHAPVNITFVQPETFGGSQFPAGMMDHAFVAESGPTYASGAQELGKRITEFTLDDEGNVTAGPDTLIEYVGDGRSSVVALAAGPDGLYFSELYEDSGADGATGAGARIYRVRYVNTLQGDYDIDGDVDENDYTVWKQTFGSNLMLAADGNKNGIVDAGDYNIWRDNLGATPQTSLQAPSQDSNSPAIAEPVALQAFFASLDSPDTLVGRTGNSRRDSFDGGGASAQTAALSVALESLPPSSSELSSSNDLAGTDWGEQDLDSADESLAVTLRAALEADQL